MVHEPVIARASLPSYLRVLDPHEHGQLYMSVCDYCGRHSASGVVILDHGGGVRITTPG